MKISHISQIIMIFLTAAPGYWNGGIIYNDRRNKVCMVRRVSGGSHA